MKLLDAIRGALSPPVPPGDRYALPRRTPRVEGIPDWARVSDRLEEYDAEGLPSGSRGCRVRVWTDRSGTYPPVVVMTDQGRGVMVALFVWEIAAATATRHTLPPQTIWITHLPATKGERYQVVTFPASTDVRDLTKAETAWIKALAGDTREE